MIERFPEELVVNQKIFKKQIYENADILAKDRQLFIDVVDTIFILLSFKPENTNIPPFRTESRIYDEVQVLFIELKKQEKLDRITDIVMRTIPYPLLIIYFIDDKYAYYLSHLTVNKVDQSKNTLDEIFYTDFIKENIFNMEVVTKLSLENMFAFYDSLINFFQKQEAQRKGINVEKDDNIDRLLKDISSKEEQLLSLKKQIRKEKQFNRQVELNVKIKKLKKEINKMKGT